jgi:hypothetical protein
MSERNNTSVIKLLTKLRIYLLSISNTNTGRVSRKRTVDGREMRVEISAGGKVTVWVEMGPTQSLYTHYTGKDVIYYGSRRGTSGAGRLPEAETIDLLRKSIKRVYPDYNKAVISKARRATHTK